MLCAACLQLFVLLSSGDHVFLIQLCGSCLSHTTLCLFVLIFEWLVSYHSCWQPFASVLAGNGHIRSDCPVSRVVALLQPFLTFLLLFPMTFENRSSKFGTCLLLLVLPDHFGVTKCLDQWQPFHIKKSECFYFAGMALKKISSACMVTSVGVCWYRPLHGTNAL